MAEGPPCLLRNLAEIRFLQNFAEYHSTEICRITCAADVRPLPTTSRLRVTSALRCDSPTKQSACPRYKIVPCRRTKHTNLPNVLGWNLHSSIRYIHWKHYLKNSYSIGDDIMSLLRRTDIREHQVLRPPSGAGRWTCGKRNSWHLLSNTARNDNKHRHMGDDNQNIVVVPFAEAKDHTNLSWNCFRKPEISGKSLDKQWMSDVCPVWPVTTATT